MLDWNTWFAGMGRRKEGTRVSMLGMKTSLFMEQPPGKASQRGNPKGNGEETSRDRTNWRLWSMMDLEKENVHAEIRAGSSTTKTNREQGKVEYPSCSQCENEKEFKRWRKTAVSSPSLLKFSCPYLLNLSYPPRLDTVSFDYCLTGIWQGARQVQSRGTQEVQGQRVPNSIHKRAQHSWCIHEDCFASTTVTWKSPLQNTRTEVKFTENCPQTASSSPTLRSALNTLVDATMKLIALGALHGLLRWNPMEPFDVDCSISEKGPVLHLPNGRLPTDGSCSIFGFVGLVWWRMNYLRHQIPKIESWETIHA